jgi:hypothetical protein
MTRPLTRKELIELAKEPEKLKQALARLSQADRLQAELFLRYQVANEPPLPDAPAGWRQKATELGESRSAARELLGRIAATLTFDSWATAPGGIRSVASTMEERRLRFEANGIILDIRAERRGDSWDFVAGILQGIAGDSKISLTVGASTIKPGETGALQWSSKRLPARLTLHIDDASVDLPEIHWK